MYNDYFESAKILNEFYEYKKEHINGYLGRC